MRPRKPIPDLHLAMIIIGVIVLLSSMTFHYLQPGDDTFKSLITLLGGFLFGKFTNGFRTGTASKEAVPAEKAAPAEGEKPEVPK